ncbi:MAG: hypothetical protein AAFY06_12825 [Pseudomonadota bacterium]
MQALFDTTKMYPESWVTPSDIGAFYQRMSDALFADNALTQALGDLAIAAGVAGLVALPLIWATRQVIRKRCA